MKPGRGERAAQVLAALLKSGCYLALFLGMQVAVMLPPMVAAAIKAVAEGAAEDEVLTVLTDNAVLYTLISGLLTLAVVLVFYLARRKKLSEALWLRPVDGPTLLTAPALVPALYLAVILVLALLPKAWTESYTEASAGIDSGTLVGVIAVVAVAPLVEEFIFRGLIMTRLSQVMPGWLAVLLSAAIFGVCHGNAVWFCYTFVLGVFFGFVDLRTGSIWPSILGHVAFNAIGQIFTFIPETEEGTEVLAALGVLLLVAVVAPILNRRAIADLFRRGQSRAFRQEPPALPGVYEFDPWEE